MSCYFRIEETNFKLKRENLKDFLKEIEKTNIDKDWGIRDFENLKSVNKIFDYLGIKIVNNDLENTIELDEEEFNDTYEMYEMKEIFEIMAKYLDDCYIQIFWQEFREREKWTFKNGKMKVFKEIRKWEEE